MICKKCGEEYSTAGGLKHIGCPGERKKKGEVEKIGRVTMEETEKHFKSEGVEGKK